jgi:hypothetical protein
VDHRQNALPGFAFAFRQFEGVVADLVECGGSRRGAGVGVACNHSGFLSSAEFGDTKYISRWEMYIMSPKALGDEDSGFLFVTVAPFTRS